ncbi:hypothetical protein K435DRAFT_803742 [Dendrothele bispora CBS 962.96]|uniref:Uncharacterized protein n=1 Tax=Dendrothele bispora (strain CBS 962.96) TaxID=1314807 RepID=A0A4S8LGH3_DENBC|nr:hypothetical protein K435DRAFT_803742 [Dendrothele bispora CBS 962.96]
MAPLTAMVPQGCQGHFQTTYFEFNINVLFNIQGVDSKAGIPQHSRLIQGLEFLESPLLGNLHLQPTGFGFQNVRLPPPPDPWEIRLATHGYQTCGYESAGLVQVLVDLHGFLNSNIQTCTPGLRVGRVTGLWGCEFLTGFFAGTLWVLASFDTSTQTLTRPTIAKRKALQDYKQCKMQTKGRWHVQQEAKHENGDGVETLHKGTSPHGLYIQQTLMESSRLRGRIYEDSSLLIFGWLAGCGQTHLVGYSSGKIPKYRFIPEVIKILSGIHSVRVHRYQQSAPESDENQIREIDSRSQKSAHNAGIISVSDLKKLQEKGRVGHVYDVAFTPFRHLLGVPSEGRFPVIGTVKLALFRPLKYPRID